MSGIPIPSEVLGAMITPAVLISAAGVLVLSTSNRLGRIIDRIRTLTEKLERLQVFSGSVTATEPKRKLIADQLSQQSQRALLLRSALSALYAAIGFLVGTSILVSVVALLQWPYAWLPVILALAGAGALLYASLILIREARLGVRSTLRETLIAQQPLVRRDEKMDRRSRAAS
jgi:hypothetical protein